MAELISIEELEATINKVRRLAPPIDGVLSPDLRTLAEIYGAMIFRRWKLVDLDQLDKSTRLTAAKCLGLPRTKTVSHEPELIAGRAGANNVTWQARR